ncbi:hypothetical protein HZZ00_18160 [Streptomyces sp. NEAU-sy36]|nr:MULTISPECIES: hypothetical protein [unclassified Streptomyces]QLJ02753.1 hypothetical protein HZZ00_18160 [Streptomyces sp. NEAU-sy36]
MELNPVRPLTVQVVQGLAPEPAPHRSRGPGRVAVVRSSSVTATGTAWC